jgi:hypothetical protein
LAAKVGNHVHRKVNPEAVHSILRKNDFQGIVARIKPFISQKNQEVQMKFTESRLDRGSEFWKTVSFADRSKYNVFGSYGHNCVWRTWERTT